MGMAATCCHVSQSGPLWTRAAAVNNVWNMHNRKESTEVRAHAGD